MGNAALDASARQAKPDHPHARGERTPETGDRLAVIAALAAHISDDVGTQSIAAQMADSTDGAPKLSDRRFRRLLEIEQPESLLEPLRRAIRLLRGRANLPDLARSVMAWGTRFDRRRQWAYDYYANAPRKEKSA